MDAAARDALSELVCKIKKKLQDRKIICRKKMKNNE
jgi:hypothetical protein